MSMGILEVTPSIGGKKEMQLTKVCCLFQVFPFNKQLLLLPDFWKEATWRQMKSWFVAWSLENVMESVKLSGDQKDCKESYEDKQIHMIHIRNAS